MIFSVKSTLPVFAFCFCFPKPSLFLQSLRQCLDTRGRGGETYSSELRPNDQTLNILWWLFQKHTGPYSCYRINWYPFHMPTVLKEKPWDTRLAFSENTAYHPFYLQISKVRIRKTWTDDCNVIFIPSSPMMNNDYKNIICSCQVWLTFRAPGTCCCNKKKTVFLTPPPSLFFTDYPQYWDVSIGNHMILLVQFWDKSALVNFSKTDQIARARARATFWGSCNFNVASRLDKKKQFQPKVSLGSGLVSLHPHL